MGTMRLLTFCLSICAVIGNGCLLNAQTQSGRQSAYPTNSRAPSAQARGAAAHVSAIPEWMKPNKPVHNSFQDRANALLAEQEAADRFVREHKTSHPHFLQRPQHLRSVGFRNVPTQDDPFGENQNQASGQFGQAPGAPNQFDPFADPPKAEQPKVMFGPDQIQAQPIELPGTRPKQSAPSTQYPQSQPDVVPPPRLDSPIPAAGGDQEKPDSLTNPFADPPKQKPDPSGIELPGQEKRPTQPTRPRENGADKPSRGGQDQLTDPFKDPTAGSFNGPPTVDNGVEYHHGSTLQERYVPPAGVYSPPIVQPNYGGVPGHDAQPMPQLYQPAYQPIPGYAPGYQSQSYPPNMAAPPVITAPSVVTAPPIVPSTAGDVYSPVVAPIGCDACGNECTSNSSLGCNAGCPNFYFSAFVGSTSLRDLTSHSGLGEFQTESGTGFGFAMGRRNGRNLRTELEFSFRNNDIAGFDDGVAEMPLVGEMTAFSGMANAYWELVDVPSCNFKPYVGGGVGFISIDSEIGTTPTQSILVPGTDNDTSFAFQYMVGVNYKAFRNVDLFAEYRLLKAESMRLDTVTGNSDRYDYHTDNIFMGLRWKF